MIFRKKEAPSELEQRQLSKLEQTGRDPGVLSVLTPQDRLVAILYALNKAKEAGTPSGPTAKGEAADFDTEAACAALERGRFQLRGTAEEIHAQLMLIDGVSVLLRRTFAYPQDPDAEPGVTGEG